MFCRSGFNEIISLKKFLQLGKYSHYVYRFSKINTCSFLCKNEKECPRYNPINIQMLSYDLHKQIFGNSPDSNIDSDTLKDVMLHLSKHGLLAAVSFVLIFIYFIHVSILNCLLTYIAVIINNNNDINIILY